MVAFHQIDVLDRTQLGSQGLQIRAKIPRKPCISDDDRKYYAILRGWYGDDFSGPLELCLELVGQNIVHVSDTGTKSRADCCNPL